MIIDVSPGAGVDPRAFMSSIDQARRWASYNGHAARVRADANPGDNRPRFDSGGDPVFSHDAIDQWHRHVDAWTINEAQREMQGWAPSGAVLEASARYDSAHEDAGLLGGAGGFPRDFEFIRNQIWEEKLAKLSAMGVIPIDRSVPLGARRHTGKRALIAGEAALYDGNAGNIPRARVVYDEETFGMVYIVCAVDVNFFDALSTDWEGLQQYQRELRAARRLVEERINRLAWFGDVGANVPGVLTYPSLAKQALASPWTEASTPEDIAAQLADFVGTPMTSSGEVFQPNILLLSPMARKFLFTRKHSTSGGTDTSIGRYFLEGQKDMGGIERVVGVPEFAAQGPGGEDVILATRDDLETMGLVLMQETTPLPVFQASPLQQTTVVFAAMGGTVMPDVGNAIEGYVTVR